jgi:hypothetical protein
VLTKKLALLDGGALAELDVLGKQRTILGVG